MKNTAIEELLKTIQCIEKELGSLKQQVQRLNIVSSPNPTTIVEKADQSVKHGNGICDFADSNEVINIHTAKGRFMRILRFIFETYPKGNEAILTVQGRPRRYFARTLDEIESSGRNTFPEKIPNTNIYAATNLSNDRKVKIVEAVLRQCGESCKVAREASKRVDSKYDSQAIFIDHEIEENELQI